MYIDAYVVHFLKTPIFEVYAYSKSPSATDRLCTFIFMPKAFLRITDECIGVLQKRYCCLSVYVIKIYHLSKSNLMFEKPTTHDC